MKSDRIHIYDFLDFGLIYRAQYTRGYGRFIGSRRAKDYNYNLYQVEDFYVEVEYDRGVNCVTSVDAFTDTSSLAGYLDNIKLDDLL